MEMTQRQADVLRAFVDAMCDAIDQMGDLAQHIDALEAVGIDLQQISVNAHIKVNADPAAASVPTGVPLSLVNHCHDARLELAQKQADAAFLRGLRIAPDLTPAADAPQAAPAADPAPARRTWWQRLHGGRL